MDVDRPPARLFCFTYLSAKMLMEIMLSEGSILSSCWIIQCTLLGW